MPHAYGGDSGFPVCIDFPLPGVTGEHVDSKTLTTSVQEMGVGALTQLKGKKHISSSKRLEGEKESVGKNSLQCAQ